ncbi:MAG: hypothetical protein INR65_05270 [Gluconacetobacter diazotrophicus]|nr:hypothetical protein [Gluconacetobacter diazotrophicus]
MSRCRSLLSAAVLAAMALGAAAPAALAAPCRDAKGKFITCPPPAPAKKAACRDAGGKFTKCPAAS